jgi:hypothetical protein
MKMIQEKRKVKEQTDKLIKRLSDTSGIKITNEDGTTEWIPENNNDLKNK